MLGINNKNIYIHIGAGKAPVTASRDGQLVFCQSTTENSILVFNRYDHGNSEHVAHA